MIEATHLDKRLEQALHRCRGGRARYRANRYRGRRRRRAEYLIQQGRRTARAGGAATRRAGADAADRTHGSAGDDNVSSIGERSKGDVRAIVHLDLEQPTQSTLARLADDVVLGVDDARDLVDGPEATVARDDGAHLGAVARRVLGAEDRAEVELVAALLDAVEPQDREDLVAARGARVEPVERRVLA